MASPDAGPRRPHVMEDAVNVALPKGLRSDPAAKTPWVTNARHHIEQRWTLARSAARDQIKDQSYGTRRRISLHRLLGGAHHLTAQYGMQTASRQAAFGQRQHLRSFHPFSAFYHRISTSRPDAFDAACLDVYTQETGDVGTPESRLVFVNSAHAVARLDVLLAADGMKKLSELDPADVMNHPLTQMGAMDPQNLLEVRQELRARERSARLDSKFSIHRVGHGLVAMKFALESDAFRAKKRVQDVGGTPSSYQILKLLEQADNVQIKPDLSLRNDHALAQLVHDEQGEGMHPALRSLSAVPAGHPAKALAGAVVALVSGLEEGLAGRVSDPDFVHDPLVGDALAALQNVLQALPTLTEDTGHLHAAYEVLMDELALLLAAAHPYAESDFKQAALASFGIRSGRATLRIARPEVHLCSSGMDSLSQATFAARKLAGESHVALLSADRPDISPEYFEVPNFLQGSQAFNGSARVLLGSLNPSMPEKVSDNDPLHEWSVDRLLAATNKRLVASDASADSPVFLVLDSTVERIGPDGRSELAAVLDGLKAPLENGRLRIILSNSLQKFQSLGSAKVMAGSTTVLGRDDAITQGLVRELRETELELGWMKNDESQFMTHLLKQGVGSEAAFYRAACANAEFVHRHCLGGGDGPFAGFDAFDPGLPFGKLTGNNRKIKLDTASDVHIFPKTFQHFLDAEVDARDSFGFVQTIQGFATPNASNVDESAAGRPARSNSSDRGDNDFSRIAFGQEPRNALMESFYGLGWLKNHEELTPDAVFSQVDRIASRASALVMGKAGLGVWADTAIDILEKRSERSSDKTLKTEVQACHAMWLAQKTRGAEAPQLRARLVKLLQRSERLSPSLGADQLRILSTSLKPSIPDEVRAGDDLAAMRQQVDRTPQGMSEPPENDLRAQAEYVQWRYATNQIASMLSIARTAFGDEKMSTEERRHIRSLRDGLLEAGLPGLSPEGRRRLILDAQSWTGTDLNLRDKSQVDAWTQRLVRQATWMPHLEDKAEMFRRLPDKLFGKLPSHHQQSLLQAFFAPLDTGSRRELVLAMEKDGAHPTKRRLCGKAFRRAKRDVEEGRAEPPPKGRLDSRKASSRPC